MNKALEDYKTFSNQFNSRKKCEKDEVVVEMKKLWDFKKDQEKELLSIIQINQINQSIIILFVNYKGIRKEIRKTDKDITAARKELKKWDDFKNIGTKDLANQIRLLKKELDDMTDNYNIISSDQFIYFKMNNNNNFKNIYKKK